MSEEMELPQGGFSYPKLNIEKQLTMSDEALALFKQLLGALTFDGITGNTVFYQTFLTQLFQSETFITLLETIINENSFSLPAGDLDANRNFLSQIQNRALEVSPVAPAIADDFATGFNPLRFTVSQATNGSAVVVSNGKMRFQYHAHQSIIVVSLKNPFSMADGNFIAFDLLNMFPAVGNYNVEFIAGLSNVGGSGTAALPDAKFLVDNGANFGNLAMKYGNGGFDVVRRFVRFIRVGADLHVESSNDGVVWNNTYGYVPSTIGWNNIMLTMRIKTQSAGSGNEETALDVITSNIGSQDTLTDKSIIWFDSTGNKFTTIPLAALKAALAALP